MNIDSLIRAANFFVILSGELIVLFIGISFLVGLLQEYIPPQKIQQALGAGRNKIFGGVVGAGFGSLTPFCSCSTIPITLGLLNSGVPFNATMSFFMASPLLNPVILILLFNILGLKNTVLYVVFVFPAAVLTGFWWEKMGLEAEVKKVRLKKSGSEDLLSEGQTRSGRAFQGAVAVFRQVLPWLILGAGIGSFIYGYVPEEWILRVAGPQNYLAIPAASVIGIPMYIRVETMLPISSVLLGKGMNIGAVMALIIGGASASIPEITLMGAIFKRKLVIIYVITVLLISILAGSVFMLLA